MGDEPAKEKLILINNQLLNSNPKGKVIYRNLPDGNYDIQIKNSGAWYGDSKRIDLKQDTTVNIPLIQIGKINGSLSFSSNKFSVSANSSLGAITITAINKNGKAFETKTDSKGFFIFFLPEDTYTLLIKKDDLNPQTECMDNEQTITVDKNKPKEVSFRIQAKQMIIETKKFFSSSPQK